MKRGMRSLISNQAPPSSLGSPVIQGSKVPLFQRPNIPYDPLKQSHW